MIGAKSWLLNSKDQYDSALVLIWDKQIIQTPYKHTNVSSFSYFTHPNPTLPLSTPFFFLLLISRNKMNVPIRDCHIATPKASSHAVNWKHLTEDGGGCRNYTKAHLYRWSHSRRLDDFPTAEQRVHLFLSVLEVLADGKSCRSSHIYCYRVKSMWFLFLVEDEGGMLIQWTVL